MGKVKPTLDMELGRHARKAVQVIRDRGHTVRMLENDEGNVCLLGAMYKAMAPMGKAKVPKLVETFNKRFGQWMVDNYPLASVEVLHLVEQFERCGYGAPVAATWNDRVLLHGEEACAWLDKFADAVDPQ